MVAVVFIVIKSIISLLFLVCVTKPTTETCKYSCNSSQLNMLKYKCVINYTDKQMMIVLSYGETLVSSNDLLKPAFLLLLLASGLMPSPLKNV